MVKLVLLSDTHFSKNNQLFLGKYDTAASFRQVSTRVSAEAPDYIFVLGDISQDGSPESYAIAQQALLQFNCPIAVIMGNHDTSNIKYLLSERIHSPDFVDIEGQRFIFLSSYKGAGFDAGFISTQELDKIPRFFAADKQNHVIMHHHFIKTNSVIDNVMLENHAQFCEFIAKWQLLAVWHGHVHHGYDLQFKHIKVHANPSTCVQFAFAKQLVAEPIIGYRLLEINGATLKQRIVNENIRTY